jgi:1-acyl-sn-glycerol-3-phosphate acyltransferase
VPTGKATSSPAKKSAPSKAAKAAEQPVTPAVVGPQHADEFDLETVQKLAPFFRGLRTYFRLRVDGLDHLPHEGSALLAANHTGWLGLDYALTALSIYDAIERIPRGMAHEAWFRTPATSTFAKKVGLFPVTKDSMAQQLQANNLVMVFPEGERGAFRPGSDYTLEPFARGFVRVAMATQRPVIPVCILGGEESNPVGTRIESYEQLLNLKGGLPIPRNLLPKPVKWRIRFLPAISFADYSESDAADRDRVHAIAEDVRTRIQRELRKMKVERGHPYI